MLKCNLTIKFWSVIAVFFLLCFNYLNIEKPSVKMSYCSDVSLFPFSQKNWIKQWKSTDLYSPFVSHPTTKKIFIQHICKKQYCTYTVNKYPPLTSRKKINEFDIFLWAEAVEMFHTRKLNKNHKKGVAYNFVVPKLLWANDTLVWVKAQLVILKRRSVWSLHTEMKNILMILKWSFWTEYNDLT